jgi:hypothetical protein
MAAHKILSAFAPGLALLLLATPAYAADWARISAPGPDSYAYDRSKLFVNGDEITYWKKVAFGVPQPVNNRAASTGLYRERINCAEHTLKLISYLFYASDGSVIEYVANKEGEPSPIIPDTLGDVFERRMCAIVAQRQEAERRRKAAEAAARQKAEEKAPETPASKPEPEPETQPAASPGTPPEQSPTPEAAPADDVPPAGPER